MSGRVILLGGGGHAKVVADALTRSGAEIVAISLMPGESAEFATGARRIADSDILALLAEGDVSLANGIGGVGDTAPRKRLFDRLKGQGATFATVIHPSAVIAESVRIGEGAQIMAGVVLQPDVSVGANTIVNTRASIDHDCRIGDHVHIAPGVTLSGDVTVGDGAHVGTGACAIQGTTIGESSVVGAGALVLGHVRARERYVGLPARPQTGPEDK
jgi:UDP-perosamine 4-acetyltransferase